jgi:hypothetical protein
MRSNGAEARAALAQGRSEDPDDTEGTVPALLLAIVGDAALPTALRTTACMALRECLHENEPLIELLGGVRGVKMMRRRGADGRSVADGGELVRTLLRCLAPPPPAAAAAVAAAVAFANAPQPLPPPPAKGAAASAGGGGGPGGGLPQAAAAPAADTGTGAPKFEGERPEHVGIDQVRRAAQDY